MNPLLAMLAKRRTAPALVTFDFPTFFGARDGFVICGYPGFSDFFTDSAGTTPALFSWDPVGRQTDVSGNANHPIQTVSMNKPAVHRGPYTGGPPNTQIFTSKPIVKQLLGGLSGSGPGLWLESPYQITNDTTIISINVTTGFTNPHWHAGSYMAFTDYVGNGAGYDMARLSSFPGGDIFVTDVITGGSWAMTDTEIKDIGGGDIEVTLRAANSLATSVASTTVTRTGSITPAPIRTGAGSGPTNSPFLMAIDGQLSAGERTTIYNLINDMFTDYL